MTLDIIAGATPSALGPRVGDATSAPTAPLSFAQARLWLLAELYPESRAYNLRTAYLLEGDLDRPALQRALTELASRHQPLRTTFDVIDGEPLQIIGTNADVALRVHDLSDVPADSRDAVLQGQLQAAGAQAFDLRRGPLFRAELFRLGPTAHVLLLGMHHLVFDDGSVAPFNRELGALYAAHRRGRPHDLPDLPVAYCDFSYWQHELAHTDEFADQLAYWRAQLAGAPPCVELPLDRPRPPAPSFAGATRSTLLSPELSDGIRALGAAYGTTLFMTLLAAFDVLLYRYTGARDLVVGSPIANRTRTELEPLVGFFVNTVALRTQLSGDDSFASIARRVREAAIGAYDNADVPFERVVAELHPERSRGSSPLVNVMFFVRADLGDDLELDGLTVARMPLRSTSSRFDLTLRVSTRPDGLACSLQYDTALFDAPKIDGLLTHFARLLESIVAAPDAPIAQLAMLAPAEQQRIALEWNAPAAPYAHDRALAAIFERQAERTPDAVAVADGSRQLTYGELNARANRLAHLLRAEGFETGDKAAICLERSIEMVVATLAVNKAGGAYLPLDPDYPHERLRYMLQDAQVRRVLVQPSTMAIVARAADVATVDVDDPRGAARSGANPDIALTPDATAYVMYTSGTTGRPKGVIVPARAVSRLVTGTSYVTIGADDAVAQVANPAFDAATFELWGSLLNGARLEIIPREVTLAPAAFATTLAARGVSVMFLTAALFRYVAQTQPATFAGLRCLLVGGEALDPAAARAVLAAGPPGRLVNAYGPTEVTTFACTHDVGLPIDGAIPIGRPISNTEAYILDADGNLLPPGVPGQLYLGGPRLADGYLNDPELTARKFVAHPFSNGAGARLYATGDRAQYRSDGAIDFLGRLDRQVKVRGFRIELDEVETALRALPDVRDALVVARGDAFGEARLVGYVIDAQDPPRETETWRRALSETLPREMLPGIVIAVPAFPLTANGKIDRAALPLAHAAPAAPPRPLDDPRYGALVDLWTDLLGTAGIATSDNFFDAGGHSLLAARMIANVSKMFARRVSLAAFLIDPTIDHLVRLLTGGDSVAVDDSPVTVLRSTGTKAPLFFLHGDFGGGGYYTRRLVRAIDDDRPVYVLPPHGLGTIPMPASVEEMAADYVREIRAVQPRGPYVLGGFCMGGVVAFEMARQLHAARERVADVIMIDAPGSLGRFAPLVGALDRAASLLRLSAQQRARLHAPLVQFVRVLTSLERKRDEGRLIDALVQAVIDRRAPEAPPLDDEISRLYHAWHPVSRTYFPRPYPGHVALLLPAGDIRPRAKSIAGWKAVTRSITVAGIPGEHMTCLTEHIDESARRFNECLRTVEV